MNMTKHLFQFKNLLIIFLLLSIISCSKKSDDVYEKLNSAFTDSIEKSKAKRFDFQYDTSMPQSSYFLNCKLKFLKLEEKGQVMNIRRKVIFDHDSITTIYMINSINSEIVTKKDEVVSVVDYKDKNVKTYINNKLVRNLKITKSSKEEQDFIYEIKDSTELKYNCGKPLKSEF